MLSKIEQEAIRRAVRRGYLAINPEGEVGFHTDADLHAEDNFIVYLDRPFPKILREFIETFCARGDVEAAQCARGLSEVFLDAAYRLRRVARMRETEG